MSLEPGERTDVEFMILADFAEVLSGKLYLMGGGWAEFSPPTYPAPMRFALAIGVRVPFLDANTPHHLLVECRTGEGTELFRLQGDIETGRPPGSRGESQLVPIALNANAVIETAGTLEFVASVDGEVRRRLTVKAKAR